MDEIFSIVTEEKNVWKNLAFETCLVNYAAKKFEKENKTVAILFLWTNDNTIVIGKHQNPYKECNFDFVKSHDIKIARRITGGGAVYHDKGNLNFSFILTKDIYDKAFNFKIITDALNNIGIKATLSGRNDILIDGKKFSGNAFYQTKNCGLHHGTILINASSEIISKCLTPNKYKLKSKGVDSVKSRITNIKESYPDITHEMIEKEIEKEFKKAFLEKNNSFNSQINISREEIEELYIKYASDEWRFGNYLEEGIELSKYFEWGEITLRLLIENGKIVNLNIISDTLETEIIDGLLIKLKDCKYEKTCIEKAFNDFEQNKILFDIKSLITENINQTFMLSSV